MDYGCAYEFLNRHGMLPERIDPVKYAPLVLEDMKRGLAGEESSMPMIPAYLTIEGELPQGKNAVVIDAGGTNFRCGLLRFEGGEAHLEQLKKCKMPGIDAPADWEDFVSFIVDNIQEAAKQAQVIGFCFSYSAHITPQIDGKVIRIDKEVVITGSEGKLVGASVIKELERRGIHGKRALILNDTVAALLGASATMDKSRFSGFVGQISGTGTNTCCSVSRDKIGKLGAQKGGSMLINMESGLYDGFPRGDFDLILDRESNNPGLKFMEKITAGVYLGELCRLMALAAAKEGELSPAAGERVKALGRIDSAIIDGWSVGEGLDGICETERDREFLQNISVAMFRRSALCMCTVLTAIALLNDAGSSEDKPMLDCAEGSLVQKSRLYRAMLEDMLREYTTGHFGRHVYLTVGYETTLPGAAAAALLNV